MDIITNLGHTFSKFKDLLQYMQEEKIEHVEVQVDYWGAIIPKDKLNIEQLKKIVEEHDIKAKHYCDCGNELTLDTDFESYELDRYDNKILVCNKYFCNKCYDEYEINEEIEG